MLGKRLPLNREMNHPNCGIAKGHRLFVKGTVNQVKKVLKKHAKKVQHSGFDGVVEVIHTHHGSKIIDLLNEAKLTYSWYPVKSKQDHYKTWYTLREFGRADHNVDPYHP